MNLLIFDRLRGHLNLDTDPLQGLSGKATVLCGGMGLRDT